MQTQYNVIVISGDAARRGRAIVGPAGIAWRGGTLAWVNVEAFGVADRAFERRNLAGVASGVTLGWVAAAVSPVYVAAAALTGALAGGLRRTETWEVWTKDRRRACLKARPGVMDAARQWHAAAQAAQALIEAQQAALDAPPARSWKLPFRR